MGSITLDKIAIIISTIAVIISIKSCNETSQTRLDVRRSQVRTETLSYLDEVKNSKIILDCYDKFNKYERSGKKQYENLIKEKDTSIRKELDQIHVMSDDSLNIIQNSLNKNKGQINSMFSEQLITIKLSLSKDLLDKAELVCKEIK